MPTVVSVNAHEGTLNRYEIGGTKARRTHCATINEPCTFTAEVVELFRMMPPDRFAIGPAPTTPSPTAVIMGPNPNV